MVSTRKIQPKHKNSDLQTKGAGLRFPDGFFWGASTSSHQVEGDNHNDWTEWEKQQAPIFAARAAKSYEQGYSVWGDTGRESTEVENYISGKAGDHYHLYEQDFDLARSLNLNAYRFSIEWSRIEPEEGKFNEEEIEHYRDVIKALRARGIEPFVTLWHWTMPIWVRDQGGFESTKTVDDFCRFVDKVASNFGEEVTYWLTLNEPEIYTNHAYFWGIRPPQKKNWFAYMTVINRLIETHRKVYPIIKKYNPKAQVGVAKDCYYLEAYPNTAINRALKRFGDWWWNYRFYDGIGDCQDFLGVNYYLYLRVRFALDWKKISISRGADFAPEGLYYLLKQLKRYNKPIYITENGLPDAADSKRPKFIEETVKYMYKAIQEGIDLRGYLHWSLLDNFEWESGFRLRFGLIEIDYKTLKRTPRSSAKLYAKIAKANGIELGT